MGNDVMQVVQQVYEEVRAFHDRMPDDALVKRYGFAVLLAPPSVGSVAFVGINPRRSGSDHAVTNPEAMRAPPTVHLYGTARGGDLAPALQRWLDAAARPPDAMSAEDIAMARTGLMASNAYNMLFFGSSGIDEWSRDDMWGSGGSALRERTERACAQWVSGLTDALRPPVVIALGLDAFAMFGRTAKAHAGWSEGVVERQALMGKDGRRTASVVWATLHSQRGTLSVVGVPHPSGAWGLTKSHHAQLGRFLTRLLRLEAPAAAWAASVRNV
jgi:hypothetical protein